MNKQQMADHLALEFLAKGYEWIFADGKRIPDVDDFLTAFEEVDKNVSEGQSVFVGRLVISKSNGHTDIFLHQGEIE